METPWFVRRLEGVSMKRVNLYDFYQMGSRLHPVTELPEGSTIGTTFLGMMAIQRWLPILLSPDMSLRVSRQRCHDLMVAS